MKLVKTLLIALAACVVVPAYAQDPAATPKLDKRQANQAARIEQGKASGQLNARETARLEKGQAKVETAEAAAKADGKVTKKERTKLQHMENKQSRRIAEQKHDAQVKPAAPTN